MRRTDFAATKSTLLRMKEHYGFIRSGHELLDQKREILLEELVQMHRETGQLRRERDAGLQAVYRALREALLAAGRAALDAEALADPGSQLLRARERSVMGVVVPLLEIASTDLPEPVTAPGTAPPGSAAARREVRRLLPLLVRLTEIEVSCRRLAADLQKTQRRVNALENIFIPEYRDTIRFIEGTLEEKEREGLFQLKRLKHRREERHD